MKFEKKIIVNGNNFMTVEIIGNLDRGAIC